MLGLTANNNASKQAHVGNMMSFLSKERKVAFTYAIIWQCQIMFLHWISWELGNEKEIIVNIN